MLRNATAQPLEPAMFVIGPRLDPGVHGCDSFLQGNQIPYERLDPLPPTLLTSIRFLEEPTQQFPSLVLIDAL
jgi:thioredoxin reductase (NADPH)